MAKGTTYRLVDVEGCRQLCIPLSLWPALTGIISDNEFQFQPDCWAAMKEGVINMPVCGSYGWDGSAWRKLPLVWGYYDRWAENLGGTQSNAGTYTKLTTAVPPGYVYTLQFLTVRDVSSAPSVITIELSDGASVYTLKRDASPARYEPVNWIGEIALKEGDSVRVRLTGCGDGDTIEAVAWGHTMKVAE